jgi:hypothetical protein
MLFVWTAEASSDAVHEEAPLGDVGAANTQMELCASTRRPRTQRRQAVP